MSQTTKGSKRMSMFKSTYDLPSRDIETPQMSSMADDAMLRAMGALVLLGIGAIHFLQIVSTFQGTPLLGAAYLVLIAASLAVAAGLVARGDSRTWMAAGIVSAGAIGGYILTRLLNTPLDNQDVGNWACMLGLAALFVEGLLVALSAYAISVASRPRAKAGVVESNGASPQPVGDLVPVHVNGSGK